MFPGSRAPGICGGQEGQGCGSGPGRDVGTLLSTRSLVDRVRAARVSRGALDGTELLVQLRRRVRGTGQSSCHDLGQDREAQEASLRGGGGEGEGRRISFSILESTGEPLTV